jgi:hypothetical protein
MAIKKGPIVSSIWDVTCVGADGKEKWKETRRNVVTNEGLQDLMSVGFCGGTARSWFAGLITYGTAAPAVTDTYSSAGYTECTVYDEDRRPYVGVLGTSGNTVNNTASKAVFTINDTETIMGGCLVGAHGTTGDILTPGDTGTSGVLYCAVNFTSPKDVVASDVVTVGITLTAYDA